MFELIGFLWLPELVFKQKMSLLSYFSKTSEPTKNTREKPGKSVQYVPDINESGLGIQEYENCVSNVVYLASPSPSQLAFSKKHRPKRKSYTHFTDEQRAKIAKYAVENGNNNAIKHFEDEFPDMKEGTIRNFKKKYYSCLCEARRNDAVSEARRWESCVTAMPSKVPGHPPVIMELDGKLIRFLKGIRVRNGVINVHVVRGVTQALIASNPSMVHLSSFDMPR